MDCLPGALEALEYIENDISRSTRELEDIELRKMLFGKDG